MELNCSQKRVTNFELVLNAPIVNLEQLKLMAWDGIPECKRRLMQVTAARHGKFY